MIFFTSHYQHTGWWYNVQMYLKYCSEMLHFYKTNVAYLQVLLICPGNGSRIGAESLRKFHLLKTNLILRNLYICEINFL